MAPLSGAARRLVAATITCAVAGACGMPVVDEDFRGTPIWSYEGDVQRAAGVTRGSTYRMALFYAPSSEAVDLSTYREDVASGLDVSVPSSFVLNVYAAPGRELFLADRELAAARLVLYEDADHDRRRGSAEPFVALASSFAFLYLPRAMAAGEAMGRSALAAGFHVVSLPQPCSFVPPAPTESGDCGVPLGNACATDTDCSANGFCLKEAKYPWPAGYCVAPVSPRATCRPGAGQYLHAPLFAPLPMSLTGFYARPCAGDAECVAGRSEARIYRCDPTLLACVPDVPVPVVVGGVFKVEPLCAGAVREGPPGP